MRTQDQPGVLLRSWDEDELSETSPMETELPASESNGLVPVRFHSKVTELGVLELSCKSTRSDAMWKLELQVREQSSG
jgi:hypothetical protein